MLRPGRFERHIYLELPNLSERKEIFRVHLCPLLYDGSIEIDFLASQTPGFPGADIANIYNEAARQKKEQISKQDFLNAIDRIVAGFERKVKYFT